MANNKISFEKIMTKGECISDRLVSVLLINKVVDKIESLDFMKKLVNSSFIKGLQKFGKGWFKQIFIILGYLSIIFGIIIILNGFLSLFRLLIISSIISIIFGIITLVMGFGAIKFKKWYPFISLIQGGVYLITLILNYFIITSFSSNPFMVRPSFSGLFLNIIVFLAIFIIYYALILKNKGMFSGEMIKKVKKSLKKSKTEK